MTDKEPVVDEYSKNIASWKKVKLGDRVRVKSCETGNVAEGVVVAYAENKSTFRNALMLGLRTHEPLCLSDNIVNSRALMKLVGWNFLETVDDLDAYDRFCCWSETNHGIWECEVIEPARSETSTVSAIGIGVFTLLGVLASSATKKPTKTRVDARVKAPETSVVDDCMSETNEEMKQCAR